MNKKTTYKQLTALIIGALALTGCKTDFSNRGMYGRGGTHLSYGQFGNQYGGASYDADIGIYLVHNTDSPTSGLPARDQNVADPLGGTVTPTTNTGSVTQGNQIPSQTGVVSQAGSNFGSGATAPCMLRKIEIPKDGRGFYTNQYTNTGVARSIGQFNCSRDSKVSLSSRGAYVSRTGPSGKNITYIPLSLNGGSLGRVRPMDVTGTIGEIVASDTGYVVASLAPNDRTFDTLVVINEAYTDPFGRVSPGLLYEVQFPNHEIVALDIDENRGMLFIATRFNGNYGKIIAYNLNDSEAFAQENLQSVITRSQQVMPSNTFLHTPYGQPQAGYGFYDGLGNSIFITNTAPKAISNFDGLTAALTVDGRIFVIEDFHGDSVTEETKAELEKRWNTSIGDWEYLGSRSGYLWNSVKNTASPYMYPGQLPKTYSDIAVGNNIFYAIGENRVYYFMGDSSLMLNSSVPRQRILNMGTLNSISVNNTQNLAMITSLNGVKVCRVYGGAFNCGPSSVADLTENASATILGGEIMPKTFTISPEATEMPRADRQQEEEPTS